jgi:hypothetical protein
MMIAIDKQAHFFSGACIAFAGAAFGFLELGLVAAFTAGALKEIYDHAHPENHTVDIWDFVATCAGAMVAAGVVLLGAA